MNEIRVRFAPSPTGPLHIGGVRTALYNYLLARKYNGTFILRIEDTDQTRFVEGAEKYIVDSLEWFGLRPDEGPGYGGNFGPYRQSERKEIYQNHVMEMIENGNAYYAFDTPEELEAMRERLTAEGVHSPKYDHSVRMQMKNSLSLSKEDVSALLDQQVPYIIRIKVPENQIIEFEDEIRGKVQFQSNELDDKVLLKADGLPTYHLANIIDDHLMKITHVVRGEEWLSSTAHHVLLYRAMAWENTMPVFAHLPLILKPSGKGKLSKRDGAKFGFPVFPLRWHDEKSEEIFEGFKEAGYLPESVINFLAFLGWNPGTVKEMYSISELISDFHMDQIGKSGSRFDIDKARWFNQQYIIKAKDEDLAEFVMQDLKNKNYSADLSYVTCFCSLMKERVETLTEFTEQGYYFFEKLKAYDEKVVRKKYKLENKSHFKAITRLFARAGNFDSQSLELSVKAYMSEHNLGFGQIFPILRVALSGTTKGPGLFEMISLLGKEKAVSRMEEALVAFEQLVNHK